MGGILRDLLADETCTHPSYSSTHTSNNDGTHTTYRVCDTCEYSYAVGSSNCNTSGENGKCSYCGYYDDSVCVHSSYSTTHTSNNNGTHTTYKVCGSCGYSYAVGSSNCNTSGENGVCSYCGYCVCVHSSYSQKILSNNDGTHTYYQVCDDCGYSYAQGSAECNTSGENGKCSYCGYCEHTYSQNVKSNGDGTHTYYQVCDGCGYSYAQGSSDCNTSGEKGKCSYCGYPEYSGGSATTPTECNHTYEINKDENDHWEECSKCGIIKVDTKESHTATHESEGKCTVEGCEYQYETHEKSETIKEYKKTETGHTPVYTCTFTDCEGTHDGEEAAHTGAAHENGGKCTVEGCEYQYETHEKSTTIKEYDKTETGHVPVYACAFEGCTITYAGEVEAHTGATHENEGICTVEGCGYQYETHEKTTTIKEYKTTETNHTPVYACTLEGCTGGYEATEEAEAHTGATHENEGKCTVCEEIYQEHGKSETIKEYKKTETSHTPVYGCNHDGCTITYDGTEEAHTIEEWEDNENETHSGNCTVCSYTVTEEHNYEDGTCDKCNATESTEDETCEHTYVLRNNETQHWEECSKCEEVKSGTLESHQYENYIDNEDGTHSATCSECEYKLTEEHNYEDGKCEECDAIEPSDDENCEHTYVTKNDETHHWEECSKCEGIKAGSKEEHEYGTYTDNEDGTHSATCTECGYKLTEKHNYEEEKCEECDSIEPSDDNNDNNNDNSNDNNNDDDNDNNNNNNDNNNNNNNNNNNSNKDNTTSDKEIPKAGAQSTVAMVIIALVVVLGISMFKMNKYKDI